MLHINLWEKQSTIRNKKRPLINNESNKYFFPASEQPLCFHPIIMERGEEFRKFLLLQSAYFFMQNILINETKVVCKICEKIIDSNFSDSVFCQNLITVIIDENYHAFVANDFIQQVTDLTQINPLPFIKESSLTKAINLTKDQLPTEYSLLLEIVAVCIAENSITKELVSTAKDPEVHPFFNAVNSDHLLDEGRHCTIFGELLTHYWQSLSNIEKETIGTILPFFLTEYLSPEIRIKNEVMILKALNMEQELISKIIEDTYPKTNSLKTLLVNPIIKNILFLLKKSGILAHRETELAFIKMGFDLNIGINRVTKSKTPKIEEKNTCSTVTRRELKFLQYSSLGINLSGVKYNSRSFSTTLARDICKNYIISYFDQILNGVAKDKKICDIISHNTEWLSHYNILVTDTEYPIIDDNFESRFQIILSEKNENIIELTAVYNLSTYDPIKVEYTIDNIIFYIENIEAGRYIYYSELPLICENQNKLFFAYKKNELIPAESTPNILSLFHAQVQTHPENIAIKDSSRTISYHELHILSENVLYNLQKLNMRTGEIIAVINAHNFLYIPIIIGIIKAKMVFLPISPSEAPDRIKNILSDANVKLIVTDSACIQENFPAFCSMQSQEIIHANPLSISNNYKELQQDSKELIDLAYIIYTSGSTGYPKGVMIKHSALANFASAAAKIFQITDRDRILQFCPYHFDPSLADIFSALISGACVCIYDRKHIQSTAEFFEICKNYKISILNLPTAFWEQLLEDYLQFSLILPAHLKTVIVGGESLSPAILQKWFALDKQNIRLLTTYGPTETTIAVTFCNLNNYKNFKDAEKIIGDSFTQAYLYVLDEHLRPVPIGVPGELFIGGIGVGIGYLNQPELTTKSFIPNLSLLNPNLPNTKQIYRTGDRVSWLDTQTLMFHGRNDRQVKIRGYRVELGEIEVQLNKHPLVVNSSVFFSEQLIACIYPNTDFVNFMEAHNILTRYLKQSLPDYMIPSKFHFLQDWPLTETGKVDTKKLLQIITLNENDNEISETICKNNFSLHELLVKIWEDILQVKNINSKSNFLGLGGHSLLAMRLIALINKETGLQLTVREVLDNAKFEQMLYLIEEKKNTNKSTPILPSGATTGCLSYAQEGLWLLDYLQGKRSINYNISYAIHLNGILNYNILEQAIQMLFARQCLLRNVFIKEKSLYQKVTTETFTLDITNVSLDRFNELALSLARIPFNLEKTPPINIKLFNISENYNILLVNHHHILHDEQSIEIFIRELSQIYNALLNNSPPLLTHITRQYIDYAIWQRSVENHLPKESLNYWLNKLKEYKPLLLPFRRKNVFIDYNSGNNYSCNLDEETTKKLRHLCTQNNCTIFTGILGIISMHLHRITKENDISFATVISCRDNCLDENLIGIFLNVVILRNQIYSNNSFLDLLPKIKLSLLEATEYRHCSLEMINQAIPLERLTFCRTLIDIIVNYHNIDNSFGKFLSPSLQSKIEFIDNKTAKYGISIDIYDYNNFISIKIEYSTSLYAASCIKEFADGLITLTKSIPQLYYEAEK